MKVTIDIATSDVQDVAYHMHVEANRLERGFAHATEDAPIRMTIAALRSAADQIAEAIR